ncbi:hypothetical protein AX15_001248 [Amanita polypyramis BW_CC]|nr:hypothetical protein AX15_001248 [Amanita polypyramis BW_CC]
MKNLGSILVLAITAGICYAANCSTPADLRHYLSTAGINGSYPGDPGFKGYSQAFNLRFTIKPAAITFPTSPQQVAKIVNIGANCRYPVVARSGGHSYVANGLGGTNGSLVVDLRLLNGVSVHGSRLATAQTGNRLGDLALQLNDHGLALPHGICPYVGIGGHAAYGGWGFTSRMWGLHIDAVHSLEVALANGTLTTASATHNEDLFWAMRGAGPSIGITTSITYDAKPIPPSVSYFQYQWSMKPSEAAKAASDFQKFANTNIPKELSGRLVFNKGQALGELSFTVRLAWYGPASQFDAVVKPYLDKFNRPPNNTTPFVGTYIDSVNFIGGKGFLNTSTAPDIPDTFYVKSLMTPSTSLISYGAFYAFTSYTANQGFETDLDWFVEMDLYGGANSFINSIAADATAFANRNSLWLFQFYASSANHLPPYPNELSFLDDMVESITGSNIALGAFPNYPDLRLDNWQYHYYGPNYARLERTKAEYDPRHVFTFPQSIGS